MRGLSQAARGMLAREPLPSLEALTVERGEVMPRKLRGRDGEREGGRDGRSGRELARGEGGALGSRVGQVMEGGRERKPSSARRVMQWAGRHWLRGFALG